MNTAPSPQLINTVDTPNSPSSHDVQRNGCVCRKTPVTAPELACVEQELDDAIRDLDRASVRAMADGDPTGARLLATRMYEAIASRTPEHQARLHAEVAARIKDAA